MRLRSRRWRALRTVACWVASIAMAAGVTTANAVAAPAETDPPAQPTQAAEDKIELRLQQRLDAADAANFWVRFDAAADLTTASRIQDWTERGAMVAAALRATAKQSQAAVRAQLDRAGAAYQPFWATNAIHVRGGSLQLAEQLAARPEVASLHPTTTYAVPKPTEGEQVAAVDSVEWGIANIKADQVWDQYGTTGDGIVVANIDTGVQYDHPALVNQYRGNNGDGTFDHNYNWFDAAGNCATAPCDRNGHGTHTMGTMAGDDGADNKIGVAPGVTWIAANGCCPSDTALVTSGQWMLEPTDLAGQHPDASKRPHVVNNSWGSQAPSTDPFMEDISQAWAASGIFAMWSNGNSGPGCATATSPGSRTVNYSAGAYDVQNAIADFSSRGAGQDGQLKPNIAAPGVDVRSALPGNRYESFDGTSMASPHVAGTVALLWAAAPVLVGEVDATRQLLDGSAVDTPAPAPDCGGTDADNNIFGEGRLDALALLDAAPVGDTGTLVAKVTDAANGDPIGSAQVTVDGPVDRVRVTGADGALSLPLPAGDYTVTVSAFGYFERTANLTVNNDRTTTQSFILQAQPKTTVQGRVTDGSGHGWPLYARITVAGVPGGTYYTKPANGRYRFSLPTNARYTLTVEPVYGGYEAASREVHLRGRVLNQDVAVPVSAADCTVAGYAYHYDGTMADFDSGLPDGWTVVDHFGSGNQWRFDDPFNQGNRTGGDGGFAVAQSPGVPNRDLDSSLVTPVFDLSGHDSPAIEFRQDLVRLNDIADVDLSIDGGATWETVLRQTATARGPAQLFVPVPQAANQSEVRIRFHFYESVFNSRSWQLDDVFVGTRSCQPVAGGIVLGHVRDRNTGDAVNGATVTSQDDPQLRIRSAATPDDAGLADGFYWLFWPTAGKPRFSASADEYQADAQKVAVSASAVTEHDFRLPAGQLSVSPADVSADVPLGTDARRTFTVTNTGTAPVTVRFSERKGATSTEHRAAGSAVAGAPVVRVPGESSPLAFAEPTGSDDSRPTRSEPAAAPWVDLADYPTRIMDNAVGELDGKVYSVGGVDGVIITDRGFVYDTARGSWTEIAELPSARESAAGAFVGDEFYAVGGWGPDGRATRTTLVYDPAADSWRSAADAPVTAAAAARAVLDGKLYVIGGCTNACDGTDVQRYDPATDSWELMADYPHSAGHLACAGIAGQVVCAGGIRRGGIVWSDTYAYDPAEDTWTRKADLPITLWGMAYTGASDRLVVSGGHVGDAITNEGFAYDPETDVWSRLPASGDVLYRVGSACGLYRIGGSNRNGFSPVSGTELLPTYGDCVPADVPWLSVDAGSDGSVTLAAGAKVKVTLRLDATPGGGAAEQGRYAGGVWIKEDTPYLVHPVDVTMNVTAPLQQKSSMVACVSGPAGEAVAC